MNLYFRLTDSWTLKNECLTTRMTLVSILDVDKCQKLKKRAFALKIST
jgi:hypothetical protein